LRSASVPAPAADMVHALLLLFFRLPFHALGNAEEVIMGKRRTTGRDSDIAKPA
jgi:hypothetical protein